MFKLWAKIMADGKIRRQFVYEPDEKLDYSHFVLSHGYMPRNGYPHARALEDAYFQFREIQPRQISAPRFCGKRGFRLPSFGKYRPVMQNFPNVAHTFGYEDFRDSFHCRAHSLRPEFLYQRPVRRGRSARFMRVQRPRIPHRQQFFRRGGALYRLLDDRFQAFSQSRLKNR